METTLVCSGGAFFGCSHSAQKTSQFFGFSPRMLKLHITKGILLIGLILISTSSVLHADTVDIAIDTFPTTEWSTGIGWSESWYHEGDAQIVSADRPHSGSYHMRLLSREAWTDRQLKMQVWAEKNVPERMKKGIDWVLVSFYEEDCENIDPNWPRIFEELHAIFPNSKLGFGEVGARNNSDKERILSKYYGMDRIRPEFMGGFFWWYFKQDMVPNNAGMWALLNGHAMSWDEQYD